MNTFDTLVTGLNLAEGPRPDGKGNVYLTDVFGRGLYRYNADRSFEELGPERKSSGGCVIQRDGQIIYSGRDGLAKFDPASGVVTPIIAMIDGKPIRDVNDIEADPEGNLWGATLDHDSLQAGQAPRPGYLFRVSCNGETQRIQEAGIGNGIDFSPDGCVLYFSDSGEGVSAYDIGSLASLSRPRLVISVQDSDGIVLDSEGGIWVARYLGNTLVRYSSSGEVDTVVETPFACVTSAVFGGQDLRTLYITGGSLTEAGTGGLISMRVKVPGNPPRFTDIGSVALS